ncbi:MAG: formate/nitrite transporter family protein [Eubacteriales bacterium]|nr:formate/nitrite transporter family protein [Eubacteriales bacterium]
MQAANKFLDNYDNIAVNKSRASAGKLILLGILAGFLIGMGGLASTMASYAIENPSVARLVAGLIFPVGLIMVIFTGAELFTGDCLIFIGVLDGKVKISGMLHNWLWVYLGNFIGSLLLSAGYTLGGNFASGKEQLALAMLKTANTKCSLAFGQAFLLGIGCNILVCLAVATALMAESGSAKAIAAAVPITAFVIAGFEHSVANMYYISAGLFLQGLPQATNWLSTAELSLNNLTWGNFFVANLLPVTLGNIVGGCLFGWLFNHCHHQPAAQ